MITIQREKFSEWFDEAKPLLDQHWQELCIDTDKMILDPNMDAYLKLEETNQLMLMVLRLNMVIIGYYIGFILPGMHYKQIKCNMEDIFWIHPSKRTGTYALRLFEAVEAENNKLGVNFWKCTTKINTKAPGFLEKLGFKKFEECFYKWGE